MRRVQARVPSRGQIKEDRVARLLRCVLLCGLVALGLGCAASAKPVAQVPAVPVPPHEPMAWLPDDVSLVGRLETAALRPTPLWALWQLVLQDPAAQAPLVDPDKVAHAVFAGRQAEDKQLSFVAALRGAFGAGSVEAAAKLQNLAPEARGLITFYRKERVAYAQVYDDLVLVCSLDRVDALAARASEGDAVKVQSTPLFQTLSQRVRWGAVHFAVLAEDPSGKFPALLERRAEHVGYALPVKEVRRAGVGLELGPTSSLVVASENPDDAHAASLRAALEQDLDSLGGNMLVALVGLRNFVKALSATQDGSFVSLSGSLSAEELNGAAIRLLGLVGIEAAPSGPPAPAP
jgi:hypothetical protein